MLKGVDLPLPAEGFAGCLGALAAQGFSEADIERVSTLNPATLLGLP
ncbi:MAG: hypothetical protein ABJA98_25830 [Acidobacteriota bacterium]